MYKKAMVKAASENPFPTTAIPVRTAANSADETAQHFFSNSYPPSNMAKRSKMQHDKNEGVPVGIILFSPIRAPAIMRDHAWPFLRPIQSRVK